MWKCLAITQITGQRLVVVVARVGERRLDGCLRVAAADKQIDRHPLPRARPRVVEREVLPSVFRSASGISRIGLALGLPDAQRERRSAVFAVPVVAKVHGDLAGPEEIVRRRKHRERSARVLERQQPVRRGHDGRVLVDGGLEVALLPRVCGVAPREPRCGLDGDAFHARVVLVGHRLLIGLRDHFLANQVRAFVNGVLQLAGKDPHLDAGKRDLEARAVGLHLAALRLVARGGALDLFGLARQPGLVGARNAVRRRRRVPVGDFIARHAQRRVPEGAPLVPVEDLLRDLAAEDFLQRGIRLLIQTAITRHHAELGREIARERRPRAALFLHRNLLNRRRAVVDGQPHPDFAVRVALPRQQQRVVRRRGREARLCFVIAHRARQRIGLQRRRDKHHGGSSQCERREFHGMTPCTQTTPCFPGDAKRIREKSKAIDGESADYSAPERRWCRKLSQCVTAAPAISNCWAGYYKNLDGGYLRLRIGDWPSGVRVYPSPCTVWMNRGWWTSGSIFLRRRAMALSTERVKGGVCG